VEVKKPTSALNVGGDRLSARFSQKKQPVTLTARMASTKLSYTPTEFLVPVKTVALRGDESGEAPILTCEGSNEDCLIDFADQASLDELAARAEESFPAGTYNRAVFGLCGQDGQLADNFVRVKGKWTEGETTYFTTNDPTNPISESSDDWGLLEVPVKTCNLDMAFSSELVVADGDSVSITLFPVISGIGYFMTAATDQLGNCANGTGEAVCVNYPNLIPYVGTGDGLMESYSVQSDAADFDTTFGLMHLLFNEAGEAFGGMTFKYFRPETNEDSGWAFGQAVREITKDADDTYDFGTFGSNPSTDVHGYLNWTGFSRIADVGGTSAQSFQESRNGSPLGEAISCSVVRVDPESLIDGS